MMKNGKNSKRPSEHRAVVGGDASSPNDQAMGWDDFDFDEWMALARSDAKGFERRRQLLMEGFIQQAPLEKQKRLRAALFRVEFERNRAGNAVDSTVRALCQARDRLKGSKGLGAQLVTLRKLIDPDRRWDSHFESEPAPTPVVPLRWREK